MHIYIYIQGVSRLVHINAGSDFLGLCDKKIHINMCPILDGYGVRGNFLIPVHALVGTASYGNSWRVMYSTWWLIVCVASIILLPDSRSSQPSGSLCCGRRWHFRKTSFKHRSIQTKGNFTKLTLHLYLKCIMYYAGFLFCSVYCQ